MLVSNPKRSICFSLTKVTRTWLFPFLILFGNSDIGWWSKVFGGVVHRFADLPALDILHSLGFSFLCSKSTAVQVTIRFGCQQRDKVDAGPKVFALQFSVNIGIAVSATRGRGNGMPRFFCFALPSFIVALADLVEAISHDTDDAGQEDQTRRSALWQVAAVSYFTVTSRGWQVLRAASGHDAVWSGGTTSLLTARPHRNVYRF